MEANVTPLPLLDNFASWIPFGEADNNLRFSMKAVVGCWESKKPPRWV